MCADGGCWITITVNAGASGENDGQASDNVPAFDTSWADNEFAGQIAKPAFETWNVGSYTQGQSWEMFVQEVYYSAAKAYAAELRSYGFTKNENENDGFNGLAYIFEADNADGYHIKLVFEAGDKDGKGSFSVEISK